ncbi:serine hydrolase [Pontibacter sp. KCTC 32443]|uniref:serine hydrolase n=1 Tax=Pontibacter TaxID=323449 RepID=UPI00164DD909|nr:MULTISPECIES: serine hydrolase [Pontibacter]MBC5775709.1 serine hydrolase [Pontibacter sp. KCTC 32443]
MKKSILNRVAIAKQVATAIALAVVFGVSSAYGQVQKDVTGKLHEYLGAHLAQGTFNGVVVVTERGKPVYSQGFGMANYEKHIPNGADVKYRLGSITKSFTAVLVMQLQEQGKLNVQDKVSKYIPDFPNGDKITLHHLLSNTSGLPDFVNYWKDVNTKPATTHDIVALVKDKPLEFEPGTKWKYSSTGFVVLGQVIEKVTGKPYEKVLAQQILKPLKMHETGMEFSKPVAGMALGYNHDGVDRKLAKSINMSWCHAAGAMYSTPADLAKFDAALNSNKLLSDASKKQMFTPVMKDYGYGWVIDSVDGKQRISHSGAINGFKANFIRFPEQEIAITILSNYESQQVNGPISKDVVAIVQGGKYQVPVVHTLAQLSDAQLSAYVGEYQVAPNVKFKITLQEGQLYTEGPNQDIFHIFPEAEDKFFLKVAPAMITFEKDAEGKVAKMLMHHGGRTMPAARIN